MAEVTAAEAARPEGPREHDDSVMHVLGAKVLMDWLRNRQQLLVPLTLDLGKLEAPRAEAVIHAMIAAAEADGSLDAQKRERLDAALDLIHASERQRTLLSETLNRPKPLREILKDVQDVQSGAIVYAASLLVIDRRKLVNRHYLRYLAARLELSKELALNLQQRFGVAG